LIHAAVNVSAVQMRSPDIVEQISGALRRHGVPASRLELELTETAMVQDGERIAASLSALRRVGVKIAMDDFGTGYSSFAHLRAFELDRIKIDRSFVGVADSDAEARAVVRAVTGMARDMGVMTVGEGVETREQLDCLVELGCDHAQGHLLGRPLDADAAGRLIAIQSFDDDAAAEKELGELPAVDDGGAARRLA
jgi:EAL domain-containing protein (putative c-di-GMP-specific phosphodiesterase class I)